MARERENERELAEEKCLGSSSGFLCNLSFGEMKGVGGPHIRMGGVLTLARPRPLCRVITKKTQGICAAFVDERQGPRARMINCSGQPQTPNPGDSKRKRMKNSEEEVSSFLDAPIITCRQMHTAVLFYVHV